MTNDIKIMNLVLFKTKKKIFIVFSAGILMNAGLQDESGLLMNAHRKRQQQRGC